MDDNSKAFKMASMVSKKQGWILNEDQEFLENIILGLDQMKELTGYFHCPCRDVDYPVEQDRDVACPCVYAWEDIEEYGHCYCGLFLSPPFIRSGKEVQSIPERRDQKKS